MRFADASIFLHLILEPTDDVARRRNRDCAALFAELETGRAEIATSQAVLSEVFSVLTAPRHADLPHGEAALAMRKIVAFPGVKINNKARDLRVFDLIVADPQVSFVDALISCIALDTEVEVLSYDRQYDRIGGIVRVEPLPAQ